MSDEKDNNDSANKGQAHLEALQGGKPPEKKRIRGSKSTRALDAPLPTDSRIKVIAPTVHVEYDVEEVKKFLDVVFHAERLNDEHVTNYFDVKNQGFPFQDEESFLERLTESHQGAKLYTGTSTVSAQEDTGLIRNRRDSFKRFHVLVLDDIGTKVPLSKIPEGLDPTYKLETSKGNYQYGYVLEVPIDDYEQARALVELIYGAGFSDEGGKLVNKKVRLPQGINGKNLGTPAAEFRTRLDDIDGPYWTPTALLEVLQLGVRWSDVEKDALKVRKENRLCGTSLWSPINHRNASLDGVIDPVLEWLADNGMLQSFDGEWATITCPWADQHTSGEDTAGYAPVGSGSYPDRRAFKCFHEHGNTDGTQEFLEWVLCAHGPAASGYDPAAELVASHVYDAGNGTVHLIKGSTFVFTYKNSDAFANSYSQTCRQVTNETSKGDVKYTYPTTAAMWQKSPARVVVHGVTYDPRTTARLVKEDGLLRLNTFAMPDYGTGPYDENHVETFLAHVRYLLPREEEFDVFIMWLAAKMQNMGFRGWAMLMVTSNTQGIGRGSLETMISSIFHPRNTTNVPFPHLIGGSDFNEWQSKSIVFTSEMEALGGKNSTHAGLYNRIKDLIDTSVKQVTINNKKGYKEERLLFTSHFLMANHELASIIPPADRRFYVMENPVFPMPPSYFTELKKWMDKGTEHSGTPDFAPHVARYLKTVDVDWERLNGPAEVTPAKTRMQVASSSPLDVALEALIAALPTPYVTHQIVEQVLSKFAGRLNFDTMTDYKATLRRAVTSLTIGLGEKVTFKIEGVTMRARARSTDADTPEVRELCKPAPDVKAKKAAGKALRDTEINPLAHAVSEALDLGGM